MEIIKSYDIGKVIGTNSAGTNGDIIFFKVSKYTLGYTGIKVLPRYGADYKGITIPPDIYVPATLEGVRKGEDEILQAAIQYLNTHTN
ncbi:hypothetical protein LVD15_01845 [Fulvivirga maritima]|nr:hypothetical protein LVD15_01845 [Fulvivirga maritima]